MQPRKKKLLIVGGGITCENPAEILLAEKKKVRIIEDNINNCHKLMERFPNVSVSYGNGESISVPEEEDIAKMDVVVSLTDRDETNLVVSLFAWAKGVPSIIISEKRHFKIITIPKCLLFFYLFF